MIDMVLSIILMSNAALKQTESLAIRSISRNGDTITDPLRGAQRYASPSTHSPGISRNGAGAVPASVLYQTL
jgi:hypothetical protein